MSLLRNAGAAGLALAMAASAAAQSQSKSPPLTASFCAKQTNEEQICFMRKTQCTCNPRISKIDLGGPVVLQPGSGSGGNNLPGAADKLAGLKAKLEAGAIKNSNSGFSTNEK